MLVTVTVAPGTTPPPVSLTTPLNVARSTCASAAGTASRNTARKASVPCSVRFMTFLPGGRPSDRPDELRLIIVAGAAAAHRAPATRAGIGRTSDRRWRPSIGGRPPGLSEGQDRIHR